MLSLFAHRLLEFCGAIEDVNLIIWNDCIFHDLVAFDLQVRFIQITLQPIHFFDVCDGFFVSHACFQDLWLNNIDIRDWLSFLEPILFPDFIQSLMEVF